MMDDQYDLALIELSKVVLTCEDATDNASIEEGVILHWIANGVRARIEDLKHQRNLNERYSLSEVQ